MRRLSRAARSLAVFYHCGDKPYHRENYEIKYKHYYWIHKFKARLSKARRDAFEKAYNEIII